MGALFRVRMETKPGPPRQVQPIMPTKTKKYLEYLDKEMTIMGILSAVAIAAPAGIWLVCKRDFRSRLQTLRRSPQVACNR
jgi:hypothetical protein